VQLFLLPFYSAKKPTDIQELFKKVPDWKDALDNQENKMYILKLGDAEGCMLLSRLHEDGNIFKKDPIQSTKYLLDGAKLGNAFCQRELGERYLDGDAQVEKNLTQALYWLNLAVDQGDDRAKFQLAQAYLSELAIANLQKAFTLLNELKEQGYQPAFTTLGNLAFEGFDATGQGEPDYVQAFELYSQTDDVLALMPLANMYSDGLGVDPDEDKAQELYKEILASGDPELYDTQALMYEQGIGMAAPDIEKALRLYRLNYDYSVVAEDRSKILYNKKVEKEAQQELEAKKLKKSKAKAAARSSSVESTGSLGSSLTVDFDLAGEVLKKALNKIIVNDGSIVEKINTSDGTITISNPANNSEVEVTIEKWPRISLADIQDFRMPVLHKRVKDLLDAPDAELLEKYTQEEIDRHKLPERAIQILGLYGRPAYFLRKKRVIKNWTLPASITFAKGQRTLTGTIEEALYTDKQKGDTVYHLFLPPQSKAVAYKEAKAALA
jgi:TPR repeat protein